MFVSFNPRVPRISTLNYFFLSYLLPIVQCDDRECYGPFRGSLREVLFQRFLPAPYPWKQGLLRIPAPEEHNQEKFPSLMVRQQLTLRPEYSRTKEVSYDLFCPTVTDAVTERCCPSCGLYFASKASIHIHRYVCQ